MNQLNGQNDRTPDATRNKFRNIMNAARFKSREQARDKKRTGGGRSTAPAMTPSEAMIIDVIPDSVIIGLDCRFDSNSKPMTSSPTAT